MPDSPDSVDRSLPAELQELDRELRSISYAERPSFGPELEAELERAWREQPAAPAARRRSLLAAGVAGAIVAGLAAPQARASLVSFVDRIADGAAAVAPRPEAPRPAAPHLGATAPAVDEPMVPGFARRLEPLRRAAPAAVDGRENTFPEMVDKAGVEELILANYPVDLQQGGIEGTVGLRLWVDPAGTVDGVQVVSPSGEERLDRVARELADQFAFVPARRRGEPVGTWVEFDVVFQLAVPEVARVERIPEVAPVDEPDPPRMPGIALESDWEREPVLPSPARKEAGELLTTALGGPRAVARFGSVEAVLQGEPPRGVAPTRWRTNVAEALQEAMVRDPDNPVPPLALARIRARQGLRTQARLLYEQGLRKALRGGAAIAPTILAELHYERGRLSLDSWLASRSMGRVPAGSLPVGACAPARTTGGAGTGFASVERLVAWNYLCPSEFGSLMAESFEPQTRDARRDHALMTGSFEAALKADPGHVGANVQMLLALADEGRWDEVLEGSRRFVWAARGHPYGLLLSGLALQRLDRADEAAGSFRLALRALPEEVRTRLTDPSVLLGGAESSEWAIASEEGDAGWLDAFWAARDPVLSTEVNERQTEHLARATYAWLRFETLDSDPARIWLRYGAPDRVRVVGDRTGLQTEFWDYGDGPDLTFARISSTGRLGLTPEGRAYAEELEGVLPERYVAVAELPGQVTRFVGRPGFTSEFEIAVSVPPDVVRAASDSVALSIFLLDEEGELVSTSERRLAAAEGPVAVNVHAPLEVVEVVAEVRAGRSGPAAAFRTDTPRLEVGAQGVSISDIQVTGPAMPTPASLRRRAWWIEPRPATSPLSEEELGLYFELYDLAHAGPWYRLRVEAEDPLTGERVPLPIRPAGETEYRTMWDRRPRPGGPTPEFLTVSVADVPRGRYRIRVFADLPGSGRPLTAERDVSRY